MTDAARERLVAAQLADPITNPFGCHAGDPYPMGLTLLFWYPSADARAQALLDDHAFAEEGDEDDTDFIARWAPARLDLAAEIERAGSASLDADTVQRLVSGFYVISWIGTFDDLCDGSGELPEAVREWFDPDEEEAPPIAAGGRTAFAEALSQYGA